MGTTRKEADSKPVIVDVDAARALEAQIPEEWFTIEQVAWILEIPATSIRDSIKKGKLATWTVALGKTKFRINRSEVQRVIAESGNHPRLWYRLEQSLKAHWGGPQEPA